MLINDIIQIIKYAKLVPSLASHDSDDTGSYSILSVQYSAQQNTSNKCICVRKVGGDPFEIFA